jgi:D-alanyl-D-alanine carboxypeptidase
VLSCRSWLVANGATGEVLLSSAADTAVQIASLTKVMTAFIVLAAAEAEAEVRATPRAWPRTHAHGNDSCVHARACSCWTSWS